MNKFCDKINCKEGNPISKKYKIIYILTVIMVLAAGAWLLSDASYRNSVIPYKPDSGDNAETKPAPEVLENLPSSEQTAEQPAANEPEETQKLRENFELKAESEYIQLRLSVTPADGKREEVSQYLQDNLDVDVVRDNAQITVLAVPREEYDDTLSTIIDCPDTDNVIYKNEDYYPVACDIYADSVKDGSIPDEAAESIENIEQLCKSVIIIIN